MVKIEIRYKGPYRVIGQVEMTDPDGRVIPTEKETWLCRCGESGKAPFCDGAHKRNRSPDDDSKHPPSRGNPS